MLCLLLGVRWNICRVLIVFLKLYNFCGGVRFQVGDKNVTSSSISIYRKAKNTYMWFSNFYECKSPLDRDFRSAEVLILVFGPASFVMVTLVCIYCWFLKYFFEWSSHIIWALTKPSSKIGCFHDSEVYTEHLIFELRNILATKNHNILDLKSFGSCS